MRVRFLAPGRTSVTLLELPANCRPEDALALGCPELPQAHRCLWRVTAHGRALPHDLPLRAAGVRDMTLLEPMPRLLGGGGDGGSTGAEDRKAYLEMYAEQKPDKVDPAEEAHARSAQCTLSGAPLEQPCMADELGNLYNSEALVQALATKSLPEGLGHIRGLKSLLTLKLTNSTDTATRDTPRSATKGKFAAASPFMCPVTLAPLNGRNRFLVHKSTGVVVSERCLKEARAAVEELVGESLADKEARDAAFSLLLPQGEELEARKLALKLKAHKKEKKKGKKAAAAVDNGKVQKKKSDAAAKRTKGSKVYESLFTSNQKTEDVETFCCRNTSALGMKYAA